MIIPLGRVVVTLSLSFILHLFVLMHHSLSHMTGSGRLINSENNPILMPTSLQSIYGHPFLQFLTVTALRIGHK